MLYQKKILDTVGFLSSKTFNIIGSFAPYDFKDVEGSFDWVFALNSGKRFQLLGKKATKEDIFGWKEVENIGNITPHWYMFPLGEDFDSDGSTKFDWIFVSINGNAVYKLTGVNEKGTFKYSEPIDINYTIENNKVLFISK